MLWCKAKSNHFIAVVVTLRLYTWKPGNDKDSPEEWVLIMLRMWPGHQGFFLFCFLSSL